ncbi:hypothetical protein SDC9_62683 [bioreactor metagenome]|uniref:Uncharacterized protein n=1 Tax=bioreactor metagenome TaxID=1076179 RepID=A0A644XJF6_9ZZZZ
MFSCFQLSAQDAEYIAVFENTDATVYRDGQSRLHMDYRIEGPATQAEIDKIRYFFSSFGIFESFSITASSASDIWDVSEITLPGVKLMMHKKLFMLCGINTVFVDGEPLPVETFCRKMLKTN